MTTEVPHREVEREQRVVDTLYARLDELRGRAARSLAAVRHSRAGGNPQNRSERDIAAQRYEVRLGTLDAVENRLAFGRLDLASGERRYVGRIGLSDDDQRQLLVDWRAPAAEPFYQATAAEPADVVRRRHLALRGRRVVSVEDELLDLDAAADGELHLSGEGALMSALAEHRTGRMRDIVATIQAEQDRAIRSPMPGVLVVQGGPGTGKTAVALHRAAYLLYTHRERARSGVLVVGPSPVFLRYIEQVLPSLGETGVVMATPGRLFPGVEASAVDEPRATQVKGSLRMVGVLRRAVDERQRVPTAPRPLDVEGTRLWLHPESVEAARGRARRTGRPHNAARERFVVEVLADLAAQYAAAHHLPYDPEDSGPVEAMLRDSRDVRREVNLCWLPVTPHRLLRDLFADPRRLAAAAPRMSRSDREALHRDRDAPWTLADVPLLDEAADLLGDHDDAQRLERRRQQAERAAEVAYAAESLRSYGTDGMVSAEALAERFADTGPSRSVAERAAGDRSWAYAHVVVDEAQELSPMAWRLLVRRCPTRSMTVVGDVAQTASPAGASSWAEVLDQHVAGRWRLAELSVNYRTPAEVMALAAAVLAAAGVAVRPPRSARSGAPPVAVGVPEVSSEAVADVVRSELPGLGDGRLAVISARHGHDALRGSLAATLPPGAVAPAGAGALDAPVSVLDVESAKGLEFDVVVLLEPAQVLEQSARGAHDLYVAITRPTQRLVIVHARPLPAGMDGVQPAGPDEPAR